MIGYDGALAWLSFAATLLACYTTLLMGTRLRWATGRARTLWIGGSALVFGGGLWSAHFIGMLAIHTRPPVSHFPAAVVLSLLVAVAGTAAGYGVVAVGRPSASRQITGGFLVACGIVSMHYGDVGAFLQQMPIDNDPAEVTKGLLLATAAATAVLWLTLNLTRQWQQVAAASGMACLIFVLQAIGSAASAAAAVAGDTAGRGTVSHHLLAMIVATGLCMLLAIAATCVFFDRRIAMLIERGANDRSPAQPGAAVEALIGDVADGACDWIWQTNPSFELTFLSKRFGDTSGIPWAMASGRAFADLVDLGFDPAGMARLRAMMDAREVFEDAVHVVVLADGTARFWSLSGRPYLDQANGTFAGYRGSGTDVTARMKREAELTTALLRAEDAERKAQQARARLVDAIEAIPSGFVLHDAEDRLVLCNARYGEIYGLTLEQMTPGVTFEAILRWSAAASTYVLGDHDINGWVAARLASHRQCTGHIDEQLLSSGRWLQIEERRTSDGGIVGIRIDITEARQRKAVEREHDRTIGELKAARLIQASLLPTVPMQNEIMTRSGLDIASRSASSSELGGDLWGISGLDRRRVGFYTVDFAGHGTAAALNTFRLHTLVHDLRQELMEPAAFLQALNRRLAELLSPGMFATMFYGIIDPDSNCITYASAGSPPPVLRTAQNSQLLSLESSGLPLGITVDAEYVTSTAAFEPGAMLVLYSDMLTDWVDADGARAGEEGAFERIRLSAIAPTAEAVVECICAPFLNEPGVQLSDDLTVVCIRRPADGFTRSAAAA